MCMSEVAFVPFSLNFRYLASLNNKNAFQNHITSATENLNGIYTKPFKCSKGVKPEVLRHPLLKRVLKWLQFGHVGCVS